MKDNGMDYSNFDDDSQELQEKPVVFQSTFISKTAQFQTLTCLSNGRKSTLAALAF
mgnify:CR=1 FL=1|jgi:hypothetical protein|tara:strand:+ start:671 stop:838 length:168 start_codon:yes stop_codon:yes gene_type:complete